jgi:hypothetical protein
MEVDNAELLKSLKITNNNLLQLIMQFVSLREFVTTRFSAEAHHNPKLFRQLSEGIRSPLMRLHSTLDQDIGKGWMRWHLKPCSEKLLEHIGFIVSRLQNSLLPQFTCSTLGKVSQ